MDEVKYRIKTIPNFFVIGFCILSTIGFAFIAYLAWPSARGVHDEDYVINQVTSGVFMFFSLMSIYSILRLEKCYLTDHKLIITRPLLFIHRTILLSDIERITEKANKIDTNSRSTFKPNWVTVGHTSTLWLKNGKKLRISSMEVLDYDDLIRKIKSGRSL
jgi:hypothetical protein